MLLKSLNALAANVETKKYRGYEPFDGLNSFLRPLMFHNWLAERLLIQVVLRSPVNIRPLIGIRRGTATKGMGFMARGYLRRWQAQGCDEDRQKAVRCLDWLVEHSTPGYSGPCWGNHFDHAARPFQLPKNVPTLVWGSLMGQVFLDAYAALEDDKYLDTARGICMFVLRDLPREKTGSGTCISYVPFTQSSIHNSNMLGAALLARTGKLLGNAEMLDLAAEAMQYSCTRQRPDGSWYYGEAESFRWIDSFHTAYNLDALKCYITESRDNGFAPHLSDGYDYYKKNFFLVDGTPKYYYDRLFVVDIQAAAQAIDTLSYFADYDPGALPLAQTVAQWTIRNMQAPSGYFYYRAAKWHKMKVRHFHWGQATMFCALSHLLLKLKEVDAGAAEAKTA
jgi:hypothetical protein